MLNEGTQESTREALEKALIFMIDAYSDSGLIEKENVVAMLKDLARYYQLSSRSGASE
ncbi:MAG: hypothetical protein HMLIMOIP_001313 [Candidatus Nitrosomirales archaeon]